MKEKRIPLIELSIVIQAIVFIIMGTYGHMSFLSINPKTILIMILWMSVFAVIDYSYSKDYFHSLKMGIVFTVLWCAIETGVEYLAYFLANNNWDLVVYVLYGLILVFSVVSALLLNSYFEEGKRAKKPVLSILMIMVLVVFIEVTWWVINNVPESSKINSFFDLVTPVYYQDIVMKKVIMVFYGIEGVLCSLCLRKNESE